MELGVEIRVVLLAEDSIMFVAVTGSSVVFFKQKTAYEM